MQKQATGKTNTKTSRAHVSEAANELVHESKKFVGELYEEGKDKVSAAQKTAKEYTDDMMVQVKKNPLASVMIAAGVGFIISSILRK